jgi:hypothetical protein
MDGVLLPSDLLQAISHPAGGRVVLVVGAGCSVEAPTSLPLADECAREAHRRLRLDGVLGDSDCANASDLSCVADAVFAKTGSQRELVDRLPRDAFMKAEPNDGYLLAAAMLRERAVSCVLTLNFDLAMVSALTAVGTQDDVAVVAGPEDHHRLALTNLIYLHRNAGADPERWILRSPALAEDWRDHWEEVVAARVIGGPVTVFAGLGTPANVLVEAAVRIRNAVADTVRIYQVDPSSPQDSAFFARLNLPPTAYLQMGWGAFMRALADRLVEEHKAELERACQDLLSAEGFEDEDVPGLCKRLAEMGLLRLGRLRARWVLRQRAYEPRDPNTTVLIADLLLAVGLIERETTSQAVFGDDGVVEFRQGDQLLGSVVLASGRGIRRWLALETEIGQSERYWQHRIPRPRRAIAAGVQGDRPTKVATPKDVVYQEDRDSIVTGYTSLEMFSVHELRNTPAIAKDILT